MTLDDWKQREFKMLCLGGQFAFIESSLPQQEGHTASIESPFFSASSPMCFALWYQMYGSRK